MKVSSRILALFLAALTLVTAACAGDNNTRIAYALTGGNIYFNKSSGTVTDCGRRVTEAVIPAQIDGVAVTAIGNNAFRWCDALTSVEIPNSVTSIGVDAFSGCSGLTSVEIPNGVTSIGNRAFSRCSGLTSVEIPSSVTSIGTQAFFECSRLTNIHVASGNQQYASVDGVLFDKSQTTLICYPAGKTRAYQIPNSVTSIGGRAFESCTNLTSVEIPNSVTSIGERAFGGCSGLTSVEIPNSVTSIGERAFGGCSGLTNIHVASGNQQFVSVDGVLLDKSQTTLICYPEAKTGAYQIPNSVTSIGGCAFESCTNLTSVEIPNSVTSIEGLAFADCSGLTSVKIPDSVISIERYAFESCTNLTSVEIPNSVTAIGETAFYKCSGLTSVKIPNSLTSIEHGVFLSCSGLTSVEIPNSVTAIGAQAFGGCSGLTNVKIPDSVISIKRYAFEGCENLTSVEIPNSVTSIEGAAFAYCGSLRDVYYGGSQAQWETIDGINGSGLSSNKITIHYNASMPDEPPAPPTPEFTVASAPTVGGHAIRKADLSGLSEISVPLSISAETAVSVTVCVPFFDGGKFLGAAYATVTADSNTTSLTVPVTGNVSGAGRLNVILTDADFRPLCAAPFEIAA